MRTGPKPSAWSTTGSSATAAICSPSAHRAPESRSGLGAFSLPEPRRKRRRHEAVEIAIQHRLGGAGFNARAQILHHLIGLQHIGADLMAPADIGLGGLG